MENTTLFSSESALLLVMFLMVAVGFWLQRFKVFKVLGPALTYFCYRYYSFKLENCTGVQPDL